MLEVFFLVEVCLYAFLNSTAEESECSALHPCYFTPVERALLLRQTHGYVPKTVRTKWRRAKSIAFPGIEIIFLRRQSHRLFRTQAEESM